MGEMEGWRGGGGFEPCTGWSGETLGVRKARRKERKEEGGGRQEEEGGRKARRKARKQGSKESWEP
jgi:hypothetical protein